jgi:hypothetical protein
MIISELKKNNAENGYRGISKNDGFTASYLRDFEDSVRCAENPERSELAYVKKFAPIWMIKPAWARSSSDSLIQA